MLSYIVRRVVVSIVTVYVVISLSFVLVRLMPGNAMDVLFNQLLKQGGLTTQQIYQKIKFLYGLEPHAPLWQQYVQYISNASRGDFGQSILTPGESVLHVILQALPWTIFSVAISLLLSFFIGIAAGTVMAAYRKRFSGKIITVVSTLLSAVPNYLIALLLILLLADLHPIFPSGGAYSSTVAPGWSLPFVASVISHVLLPVATYVITAFGAWALAMKGSVTTTLGADYIRAAESRGLRQQRILQTYIGRNAMLPMVTALALSLGGLFGGSVFIETIFSYPGIGYYLIQAVNSRDYPIMMGCFILITVAVVCANFVVDLLYPLVDPRVVRAWGDRAAKVSRAEKDEVSATVGSGAGGTT